MDDVDKLSGRPLALSTVPGIGPRVIDALAQVSVTSVTHLLCYPLKDLAARSGLDISAVQLAVAAAQASYAPHPVQDPFQLCHASSHRFSTGSRELDVRLRGGVKAASVVEVVGWSNTGKTQLILTLAALAALRGKGVVLLSPDFPLEQRLKQILHLRGCLTENFGRVLSNIVYIPVFSARDCITALESLKEDIDALYFCPDKVAAEGLHHSETSVCVREALRSLGLVLLDSVSGILGPELGFEGGMSNVNSMARLLRMLAEEMSLAVVVSNALTESRREGLKVALGKSWLFVPDTRIILEEKSVDRGQQARLQMEASTPDQECVSLTVTVLSKHSGPIDRCSAAVGPSGFKDG